MLRGKNGSLLVCIGIVGCGDVSNTAALTENVEINGAKWSEGNFFEGRSTRIAFHRTAQGSGANADASLIIEIAPIPKAEKTVVAFKAHLYLAQCQDSNLLATFEYSSNDLSRSVLPQGFEIYRPICARLETVIIGPNGREEAGDQYTVRNF